MIKPYYQEPGITIYCGDCRDILPHLDPVDLVLTDPPYGLGDKLQSQVGCEWAKDWRLKVKRLIEKDREGVR